MAKMTVNKTPTPSEQIVKAASADVLVTDKRGRSFKLKKPGVLAQFRLVEALGDVAKNEVYMGMVLPLIFIVAIDDDPVVQPTSKLQVEALIQRLDEDGIEAVMNGVQEHFGQVDPAASKKKSEG
jgi:hypothetical protein